MISSQLILALDYSESIVVLTDTNGTIQYVNQTFVDKYGYTKKEAIGLNPSILNTGYHNDVFYRRLWKTIRNGNTWKGVFRNQSRNGAVIWEKATISPVKDEFEKITGFIAVKEDVTIQRNLEKKLQEDRFFIEELFDSAPVGIMIFSPIVSEDGAVDDLMVLEANPYANTVMGIDVLVGKRVSDLLLSMIMMKERIAIMLKQKYAFEAHLMEIDKHVNFRSFPFGQNKMCLFFYDVTPYKQTISALEASEERYFSLVEDAPAMICRFDKDGLIKYANHQFSDFFSENEVVVLNTSFFDYIPDVDRARIRKKVKGLSQSSPITQVGFSIVQQSTNQVKWHRWIFRALYNIEGEIIEYQSVGLDFTRLKKAEDAMVIQKKKLDTIIDNTVAGIGVLGKDGMFKLANSKLLELYGLETVEEIYNKSYLDLIHPDFKDVSTYMVDHVFSGQIEDYNIEKKYIKSDGTFFWGDVHVAPTKNKNGEVEEIIVFLTDISQKKHYESQLQDSEAQLKESNDTKDKLFSIIAHDVKNPFNAIMGFSNLLKNNIDTYSNSEIKQYVNQILMATDNVYKLLDDLLIWAKTQLGQIHAIKVACNLHDVISYSFNQFSVHAKEKDIVLNNNLPFKTVVYFDYEMVKLIFRNLIHNAIKFTPNGGSVVCEAWTQVRNDIDYWVVSVKDNGVGIRKEKIDVLFDLNTFISTDGTSMEKGTGLGLHLTKELVEKNGGFVEVKSMVGHGTEFLIFLPISEENEA